MTAAGEILIDEIRRVGPIPFRRFMEVALYHSEHGYYRRDRFGRAGDFYTAEQLQPVFGILIAARIRRLWRDMGSPADFMVVELGAGREDMRNALSEFDYVAVDIDRGVMPKSFTGVVFSNEFFDALPVDWLERCDGVWHEVLIDFAAERFVPVPGSAIAIHLPDGVDRAENRSDAERWMERIAASLNRGYVFTVDYGYTERERVRFPQGTLMSYRRHQAFEDVLRDPGEQDITAHVNFTALQQVKGFTTIRFESLARTLLDAGEVDQFAEALSGPDSEKRKLQLKTLLAGMGEMFRTLIQARSK